VGVSSRWYSGACRYRHWLLFFLCLSSSFSAFNRIYASDSQGTKRVLIISGGSRIAPGFMLVDQHLLEALGSIGSVQVEVHAENLDLVRFPDERSQRIFSEYLEAKYAHHPPDLIILVYVSNLRTLGKVLSEVFPKIPVIAAGFTEESLTPDQFGISFTGFAHRVNPSATLELMRRLQPNVRRVVVVSGTAETDRLVLERVKVAAQQFREQFEFEFWDHLTLLQLRQALSQLPETTAVLYGRFFRDAAGQAVISSQVGQWIPQWANVPVYVMTATSVGTGAVGGSVVNIETFAKRAGELARRILTGTDVRILPFEVRTDSVATFDWRALQRWHIPESRLPAGSVVRFKPPSTWQQYRWYVIIAIIIFLMQGAIIADLLLQRRRRQRLEAELQENQDLMDLAASAGEMGLWSRDLKTGELWANSHLRRLFGVGPSEAIVLNDLLARIHPEDRTRVITDVESAQIAGVRFEGEFRTTLPEGAERWVVARGKTVKNGLGKRRMGVVLDITERKRAEESLRESEERFRMMANSAPVMIWMSGTDELYTFFNKGWLDFTGRTLERELENGWVQGVHAEDLDRCLEVYHQSFDAQREFTMEYRLRRYDGEYRWVLDRGAPRIESDGTFLGYIGSCIDITERKQAETESIMHRQELAHVTRVSTMGELAASLAHELNQPLTAILSNAQAAQRFLSGKASDVEEVREILSDIVEDNKRAGEVIRRMRALVKKEEFEFSSLDLGEIIQEIVTLVHSDAVLRNVGIRLDVDRNLPQTMGDKIQLQQVLLNLLLNAFDAMTDCPADEREVLVRTELDGRNMIRTSVSDCGTGLTSDRLDKIFEPFFTTKRDGLGMGLSISRSIIEAHGGRLWAENNQSSGATFSFTLPVPKRSAQTRYAPERRESTALPK
jgi:PAS domain S-box-containing protein